MGSKSPSSLRSSTPTEGVQLCDLKQLSIERFEIYVPNEAEVMSVPAQDVPLSMLKRMGLFPSEGSDGDSVVVTWISPVMVREKGPSPTLPLDRHKALPLSYRSTAAQVFLTVAAEACASSPRGRGQFWLPVTCSNLTAFKVLRKFMPCGNCQPAEPKWETCQPACAPKNYNLLFSQDAIVIHGGHIFLSIKKMGPCKRWVEPRKSLTPEAPLTLPQQTATCMPGSPEQSQHSGDPSAAPPKKVPQRAVGLRALHLRFGVKRRVCITLATLPEAMLKTLSVVGCISLKNHPTAAQLCCKAEQKKLGSFGSSRSVDLSQNGCAEDLAGTRCSRDRKRSVSNYRGNIMAGEGSKKTVSKKARRHSGGDANTDEGQGGDLRTDEGRSRVLSTGDAKGRNCSTAAPMSGDSGTGEAEGRGLGTDEGKGVGLSTDNTEDGHLSTGEATGGDLNTVEAMNGDLSTGEAVGGDLNTVEAMDGNLSTSEAMGGDLNTLEVMNGDLSTGEAVGGDLNTVEAMDGNRSTDEAVGGDLNTLEAMNEDLSTGEAVGGDLNTVEAMDGNLSMSEAMGGDLNTLEAMNEDLSTGEAVGGDLNTVEAVCGDLGTGECGGVWGGDWREHNGGDGSQNAGEDHFGADSKVLDEAYLPMPGQEYAAEFDFDQSARDERISRIRARLSEKEAALQQLAHLPL